MKYIKLFENFNEESIHEICKKYEIENYTINEDGSIDVDGNVNLFSKELNKLPLDFRNVTGYFHCACNKLTSLEGSPKSVNSFYCYDNKLTSLEGGPKSVFNSFSCSINQLTSLENCPEYIGLDLECSNNKLISLKGCPLSVVNFSCSHNKLTSLEFMPKVSGDFNCNTNKIIDFIGFVEPIGEFYCYNNTVENIWGLFGNKEHVELLNDYDCIRGNDIVIDRLNQFLEEIDKPTVESVDGYNNI